MTQNFCVYVIGFGVLLFLFQAEIILATESPVHGVTASHVTTAFPDGHLVKRVRRLRTKRLNHTSASTVPNNPVIRPVTKPIITTEPSAAIKRSKSTIPPAGLNNTNQDLQLQRQKMRETLILRDKTGPNSDHQPHSQRDKMREMLIERDRNGQNSNHQPQREKMRENLVERNQNGQKVDLQLQRQQMREMQMERDRKVHAQKPETKKKTDRDGHKREGNDDRRREGNDDRKREWNHDHRREGNHDHRREWNDDLEDDYWYDRDLSDEDYAYYGSGYGDSPNIFSTFFSAIAEIATIPFRLFAGFSPSYRY